MSILAVSAYVLAIIWFVRQENSDGGKTSPAIWLPVVWLCIGGSRMISQWLDIAPEVSVQQLSDGSPLDRNILMGFVLIGLSILATRKQRVKALLSSNLVIVLFILYCGVSLMWSDYPLVAAKRWVKGLGDLVMVLVVLTEGSPQVAYRRCLAYAGFYFVPVSVILVKYYPELGRAYDEWTFMPIYVGVTTNKNELGMICLVTGLASVWRVLSGLKDPTYRLRTHGIKLLPHFVVALMAIWLLRKANSATSLSCFLIGSAFLLATLMTSFGKKSGVIHTLVVCSISVPVLALFASIGSGMVESLGRDATLTGRTDIWKLVINMTTNPILGAGYESFWAGARLAKIWSMYWWHPNEAHNGYIEVFINLGVVGLLLFFLMIMKGYIAAVRRMRFEPTESVIRISFILVTLIYNLSEAALKKMHPLWICLLLSIVVLPKSLGNSIGGTPETRKRRLVMGWPATGERLVHTTVKWHEGASENGSLDPVR